MISGMQTLRQLDRGLVSVREDINRVDAELNHVSEAVHQNRRLQAQSLKQLAKVRLDEIAQGSFLGELEAADQRALKLLKDRNHAYQRLENEIAENSQSLTDLEIKRQSALELVNEKAQVLIDCEHKIQVRLENDGIYQTQLKETRKVDGIAEQAEGKAKLAQKDRLEKGIPYENNPLFMYLWKRKYGTPDYSANSLTRYLDSWVEDLSDYNKYRVNYWTLLEIPQRLKLHSVAARLESDQALEVLVAIETEQAEQAGLTQLQTKHAETLGLVDGIDDDIEQQENGLTLLLKSRTEFVEAKDTFMEQSLEALSTALSNKSIYELNDAAHQTVSSQDNLIVRELAEIEEQNNDLAAELRDHRRMHEAKLDRLQQLENVRRQFKNHRYDDMRSGFGNESLITSMFSQFLNGLISSGELWRVLQRHQRHQDVGAWPDFGSGGLGIPTRRRSPWHLPSGRGGSGGSIFRMPKSGGFNSRGGSGGGFSTGGGF